MCFVHNKEIHGTEGTQARLVQSGVRQKVIVSDHRDIGAHPKDFRFGVTKVQRVLCTVDEVQRRGPKINKRRTKTNQEALVKPRQKRMAAPNSDGRRTSSNELQNR